MPFFSSSKDPQQPSSVATATATATNPTTTNSNSAAASPVTPVSVSSQSNVPPSSFDASNSAHTRSSSWFGNFFNNRSSSVDASDISSINNTNGPYEHRAHHDNIINNNNESSVTSESSVGRRARSLSRPRFHQAPPPITADEAMNLSRAISHNHSYDNNINTQNAGSATISSQSGLDYSKNNHHNYGRYDGGTLSRVVSAEPDFAAPYNNSSSNNNNGFDSSSSSSTSSSTNTSSSISSSNALQAFQQNQATTFNNNNNTITKSQIQQKLQQLQTSNHHQNDAVVGPNSPLSPTASSRPYHRLRRNSNTGSRYQGIGLVAAYDQSIL